MSNSSKSRAIDQVIYRKLTARSLWSGRSAPPRKDARAQPSGAASGHGLSRASLITQLSYNPRICSRVVRTRCRLALLGTNQYTFSAGTSLLLDSPARHRQTHRRPRDRSGLSSEKVPSRRAAVGLHCGEPRRGVMFSVCVNSPAFRRLPSRPDERHGLAREQPD